jgi:hypothetical protein
MRGEGGASLAQAGLAPFLHDPDRPSYLLY